MRQQPRVVRIRQRGEEVVLTWRVPCAHGSGGKDSLQATRRMYASAQNLWRGGNSIRVLARDAEKELTRIAGGIERQRGIAKQQAERQLDDFMSRNRNWQDLSQR